ncbi:DNA polymerase nu [Boleophthalmus pectinirostris]|uniref:DNA polymerase nu n=1 Tax=Boleophthalmus pectinirostris TaxID=150288 RepID=UPI00242AA4A6|nr:DNA polymerase nu [Boleophthalmus pectinirostris]
MEVCHIHVDKEALRRTSDLLGTKMKQLEQEAHKAAGQMFLLTSSTQLRTVLFEKLRLHERCENKKLPKTINKQQSTSEAALLQLQDLHPLPKIILEYRQIHKIKSTFVDGILSCMTTKNYISSTWYQTSVVTGRISAKHPNFQALPRHPLQVTRKLHIAGKEEEVVTVHPRAMFIPKEGWTFLSADFCQVELRLLAHLSSDPELLHVFTNPGADVFSMLASQWKGVKETEVSSEDRERAKRIVYSVVYGAGPERLSGILGVSTEQARQFQDNFLQTYIEVQNFIQKTVAECQKKGYVLSIMGRRRALHNINSPVWGVRMQAERQAVNFVVQGSAADLCKMAMIRIFNLLSTSSCPSARLIAQLHDELLYEVEDSQVDNLQELMAALKILVVNGNRMSFHTLPWQPQCVLFRIYSSKRSKHPETTEPWALLSDDLTVTQLWLHPTPTLGFLPVRFLATDISHDSPSSLEEKLEVKILTSSKRRHSCATSTSEFLAPVASVQASPRFATVVNLHREWNSPSAAIFRDTNELHQADPYSLTLIHTMGALCVDDI